MCASFSAVIFLFDESLKFSDFGFALNDNFLGVGEEISDCGGDELVEYIELHIEL